MLKKALTIYIACFITGIILSGCCNCPVSPTRSYRWTHVSLSNRAYTIDSANTIRILDTGSDFSGRNYVLRAKLDYELISAGRLQRSCFMNQAFACKCSDQLYTPEHAIISVKVVTMNAYDSTHPAMSDITEYFKSPAYTDKGMPAGLGPLNLYLNDMYGAPGGNFDLFLGQKPATGTAHQFKVVISLNDGSAFTDLTPVIRL